MKRILALFLVICVVFGTAGCQNSTQTNTPALDDHGYCLTLNKQITVVKNQITTQLVNTRLVTAETQDDYISSANTSISIVAEAIREVESMPAPSEYESNKQEALRAMRAAKEHIEAFSEKLTNVKDDNDYSAIAKQLQADDAALAAAFNVYYK